MEKNFKNSIEEIKEITQSLMSRFDLSIEEDNLGLVQKPFFYLSILEEIFGIDQVFTSENIKEEFLLLSQGEQLDFVVSFMSDKLMSEPIENLSGEEIVNGNLEHIKKLLEIFLFLGKEMEENGHPEMIPEEDSRFENFNTYNTKSELNKEHSSQGGSLIRVCARDFRREGIFSSFGSEGKYSGRESAL